MTTLQRDLKQFILRALLRAQDQPINDDTLRALLRSAFAHVAFTHADISQVFQDLETDRLLTGINDDIFGVMWTLSIKGKIKARELP